MKKQIHKKKTVAPFFSDIWEGRKPFEVRLNDCDYNVGDIFVAKEYDPLPRPGRPAYSGREVIGVIEYVLTDKVFPEGLAKGYVVLGISWDWRTDEDGHSITIKSGAKYPKEERLERLTLALSKP